MIYFELEPLDFSPIPYESSHANPTAVWNNSSNKMFVRLTKPQASIFTQHFMAFRFYEQDEKGKLFICISDPEFGATTANAAQAVSTSGATKAVEACSIQYTDHPARKSFFARPLRSADDDAGYKYNGKRLILEHRCDSLIIEHPCD